MTVTHTEISYDCGEVYEAVTGGSTAVIAMITRAENFVNLRDTTKPDDVVRPLADAMVVNQVIGGVDSVNKTIGTLSVGAKDMRTMKKSFMDEAKSAAILRGYSLDGYNVILKDSAK